MSNSIYKAKVRAWLNDCEGKLPTYNKLINNLLKEMNKKTFSTDDIRTLDFPVPTVFTDHTLETYNPAYEYETLMFTTLLGKMAQNGFIDVSVYNAQLGSGNDEDNWRPFTVTQVTYDVNDFDMTHFEEVLKDYKDIVSDSILANLAQKMLNEVE